MLFFLVFRKVSPKFLFPIIYFSNAAVDTPYFTQASINTHSLFQYFERRFSRRLRLFGASLFVLKAVSTITFNSDLTYNKIYNYIL